MTRSPQIIGASCALAAVVFFSINDVLIKALSDDYALHQVVLIRSALGLALICAFVVPFSGGWSVFRTSKLRLHLLRGCCIAAANLTFFLGLAAMELGTAVAIFFISPLVITLFSVLFLGETVGPRRWAAVGVGFLGVLVILRPGTETFQPAALLPVCAAVAYAMTHIITRQLGPGEKAVTMAIYIQTCFIVLCLVIGLAVGDGRFSDQSDPSLAFFFRAWSWPELSDYWIFGVISAGIAAAGLLISQAYRVAEAGFVAPFEYLAMPLALIWGYVVFDEIPDYVTLVGAGLIIGAGLFSLWRETKVSQPVATPRYRR